jgi:hypothetical protein
VRASLEPIIDDFLAWRQEYLAFEPDLEDATGPDQDADAQSQSRRHSDQ